MIIRFASGARPVLCLALLCLFVSATIQADEFRVGVGTGCTHATLELAVAAAAANGPDEDGVFLTSPAVTLSGLVEITNQTVYVVGGYSSCTAGGATGRTTLTRDGPTDAFWVHGTATTELRMVAIDLVMGPSGGRGLLIEGPGTTNVYLTDSSVTEGQAVEGGNIRISGAASLFYAVDSVISRGWATGGDGGGIYCDSGAEVGLDRGSALHTNTAAGSGGGAFVDNCHFGMGSGWDGIPGGPNSAIYFNEAITGKGGGIAAVGGATVTLLGSEPGQHVFLSENFAVGVAGGSGGGLSLEGAGTQATIWNSWIDGNRSHMEGGGVYVGSGTYFMMEVNPLNCWPGRDCSRLVNNDSAASGGGGIVVMPGAEAHIRRTEISGNYTGGGGSGAAVAITGAGATLHIEGCEFFRNFHAPPEGAESPRIFAGPSSTLTVAFSTIVEDLVAPGMAVLQNNNAVSMRLLSSIVQASKTFTVVPPATQVDCVIVSESASLPVSATAVATVTDPALLFHLATPTDFRILRNSQAEDFCDTLVYTPITTDFDGQERGFDDIPANAFGPFDLGADEWRPELFAAGFESGDLLGWTGAVR